MPGGAGVQRLAAGPGSVVGELPSFTESDRRFGSDGRRIFLTFFGLCSESTCSDAHRAE